MGSLTMMRVLLALWAGAAAARETPVNRSAPLPEQLRQFATGRNHCPTIDCEYLGAPAKYTGRFAVFMSGRIRVAHDMLQKVLPIIEKRYSGEVRVDWYFHVWHNESSVCERRTLRELTRIATAVTTEPIGCMWSWGPGGWQNQWHGVDVAFQTLLRFGRLDDYTLILKSRVDVLYDDFDFVRIWRRYSAAEASRRANGHFMLFLKSQGWDVHMVATPPLARAIAQYNVHGGYACDSSIDSFPWQRMGRHGVWPPPGIDRAQDVALSKWKKLAPGPSQGAEPRCAPLFMEEPNSVVERSFPYALNPDTEPRLGCPGRRLSEVRFRRLAAHRNDDWVPADDEFCTEHRHDVYFVSPNASGHRGHHHDHPARVCPPDCGTEEPMEIEDIVEMAHRDIAAGTFSDFH